MFTLIYSELLSHRDQSPGQKQKLPTQQQQEIIYSHFTTQSDSVSFVFNSGAEGNMSSEPRPKKTELMHFIDKFESLTFKCFLPQQFILNLVNVWSVSTAGLNVSALQI